MRFVYITVLTFAFYSTSFSQTEDELNFTIDSVNATCGKNNGEIHLIITKGKPPYQYSLDDTHWQKSPDFINLIPHTYYPSARDASTTILSLTKKVIITTGCLTANVLIKNSTCGINNGMFTITAANGTAPYRYSIDGINFQSSNIYKNLSPGNYVITVIDTIGIKTTVNAEIKNEIGPSIKLFSTNSDCDLNNGTLTFVHVGGTQQIQYSIDSVHFQIDSLFANLKPGNYKGYARDSNSCTAQSDIVSIYNLCVKFSLEIKNSTCGQSSGSITVNATSGIPPFLYSINGNDYQTSNIFPNLNSGKYVITVKDKENKVATNNAEIITTPPPQINLVASAASCSNNDGVILASVKNGIAPFLYNINNSSFSPDRSFKGLSIGNYIITVKDSSGCTLSVNISIPLKNNSKLFVGNDTNAVINYPLQLNAIDINNSGFTHYTWSPPTGLNNPAIANPVATLNNNITYTVTASNAIGCKASDVINIKAYNGPEIYVPTAFTPNHDGLNDKLKPIPVGIKSFSFEIYDRWSNMIFYTTDANKGWDGTIKGVKIVEGTYVWFAQGYDVAGKLVKRKGTVTLIH